MEQQAVANFERGLLDVLVRAMGRVAGLEGDDFAPSALAERGARLARLEPVFQKGAARNLLEQHRRLPPRQYGGVEITFFAPGCASSAVPKTASASRCAIDL